MEFDDSALMQAFGQVGAGIFTAPTAIAPQLIKQHKVIRIGSTEEVIEQFYAISVESILTRPRCSPSAALHSRNYSLNKNQIEHADYGNFADSATHKFSHGTPLPFLSSDLTAHCNK